MSFEVDKNKSVEQKYFNSKDNIVSADDFNEIQKSSKSFNSVFEKNEGKEWDSKIKTEFDLILKRDLESDLTLPVDALRVEKNIDKLKIENASQQALENFEKKVAEILPKINLSTNITDKYKGDVDVLNEYLKDTPLKGLGQEFLNVQEKYGVNALFMMAISSVESSYGRAPAEGTKYNIAGLTLRKGGFQKPDSFKESIGDLGSTLYRVYITRGKTTPEEVRKGGYATDKNWSNKVVEEWNNISEFINKN